MKHRQYLLDEPPSFFHRSLAEKIGLDRAVVFQQLHFLLVMQENARNSYTYVDGRYWVYNTYPKWVESYFTWMSERTCERIFAELEKLGIVISMQSVKSSMNREKWYSIDYEKWEELAETIGQSVFDQPAPPAPTPTQPSEEPSRQTDWMHSAKLAGWTPPNRQDAIRQTGGNYMPPNWRNDLSDKEINSEIGNAGAHAHTHAHESSAPATHGGEPPYGAEEKRHRPTASGLRSAIQGDDARGKPIKAISKLDLTISSCYPTPTYLTVQQKKALKEQIERFESDELYERYVREKISGIKSRLQGKAPFIKKQEFVDWLLDENSWGIYEQQWRREKEDTSSYGAEIAGDTPYIDTSET